MVDNTRGGPPSRDRKPGGGAPGGAPGGGGPGAGGPGGGGPGRGGPGGGRDNRGGPGGFRKGGGKGGFGKGGPAKAVRAETYESLKELTRGEGFRIDKFVVAEKGTHRPVKTEYRLTREGLKGTPAFARLVEAQAAAIEPLPEPEPEPEIVEAAVEAAEGDEHAAEPDAESTSADGVAEHAEHPASAEHPMSG